MYIVSLTLRSPTCVALRPTTPGQPTESLRYLTGTVLRGALAGLLLRGRRYEDGDLSDKERERFHQLFLSGEIIFGNAWPRHGKGTTQIIPRTAWTQKRGGGWRGDQEPGSGVRDALAPLLLNGAEQLTDDGFDRFDQEFACASGDTWQKIEVRRRLISRTALSRNEPDLPPTPRGVAAAGQLYSFEAIETGQEFLAPLSGAPGLLADLISLLRMDRATASILTVPDPSARQPELPPSALVSMGQGRSRGMGRATASILTVPDPPARQPDKLAREAVAFTERAGADSAETVYLPVTLLADTILRDDYLLPCSSGDPGVTLARYTSQPPPQGMRLHYAVQSTRWVGGWDELRRLPRPPQLAVQQGSVWVYAVPAADLSQAISWWLDVESQGLGERRGEGFGRLMLLHPFHAKEALR